MSEKKILFISNIAGEKIGSFSLASIYAAKEKKFEFHIAKNFNASTTDQQKKDEKEYGITIHQIDFARNPLRFQNITAYKQLVELMKNEQFDAVHCNTPTGGVYGRLAAKKCGIKHVIYQAHGFHFYKGAPKLNWLVYYPIERWLAHITDNLITINREDYDIAHRFHLRNNGEVYYVPGVGVDTELYKKIDVDKESLKKSLGLTEIPLDAILLLAVGRLDKNKNNATLIKAVAMLGNFSVHLVICGDGEDKRKLQMLAKNLNVEHQIHLLGNRSDIIQLYHIADIFVMASYREGLSRSMMEAMASGLPCVASRIRGNVDLIDEGKGGFLCEPDDVKAFASALNDLICSLEQRTKMSNYNLVKIKKFDMSVIKKESAEIYEKILVR